MLNVTKQNLLRNNRSTNGYTIVELLVVIVVIGILAAITMVLYSAIHIQAASAVLKSDLKNSYLKLELVNAADGIYPADKANLTADNNTKYEYTYDAGNNSYCLTASSQEAKTSYHIDNGGLVQSGPCSGHIGYEPVGQPGPWQIVSAGSNHSCGIASGKAYCWGNNSAGQLGASTPSQSNVPIAVDTTLMSGTVTDISAGVNHTCAITNGKAYCWGRGQYGKLGYGGGSSQSSPVAVDTTLMSGTVTDISAGTDHTCAVAGGRAYCWGQNSSYGKLGNNSTSYSNTAVAVDTSVMSGVVTKISAGVDQTCAVASGKAYCWGSGQYGNLGNGLSSNQLRPVAVSTSLMSGTVTDISTYFHSCAVANQKVYCWGFNNSGQLGNNSTSSSSTPVAVDTSLMSGSVTKIDAGADNGCAIADGKAYCWGSGVYGKLGNNPTTSYSTVPVAVDTSVMTGAVTSISAYDHTCAVANGNAYCWGQGSIGRLGNGATNNSASPTRVSALP